MGETVIRFSDVILWRDGKILLGLRSAARAIYPSLWALPGGHVEPGETGAEAAIRECREELGVRIAAPKRLGGFDMREGPALFRIGVFLVRDWDGVPAALGDEHVRLDWLAPDAAAAIDNLALDQYRAFFRRLAG